MMDLFSDGPVENIAGYWREPHEAHYAVSDVFFAEGVILMSICANRDWILMVDSHQNFHCAFDRGRYDALADALIAGRAVES